MYERTVHVVGAGLAGLSTALHLATRGVHVELHEAAGQAGGRCRSYHDPLLDRLIDNGSHLVLSGNRSTLAYLKRAGEPDALRPLSPAVYPFVDIEMDHHWTVRPAGGRLPWWVARHDRRVPDTRPLDYLGALGLRLSRRSATVAQAIRGRGALWHRFWVPLTLAVLNAPPHRASARLLWRVLAETLARGERHSRPMMAPEGIGTALVTPALIRLRILKAPVHFKHPLRALDRGDGRVEALVFDGERVRLGPRDQVVLAVPPSRLRRLMPELDPPPDSGAILNAHFLVRDEPRLADAPPFLGVLGGLAHWIFVRGDVVSVTISAAERLGLTERDRQALITGLWTEVVAALGIPGARFDAQRLIIEKRATFDQSPQALHRRPAARTSLQNLFLAGDVTDTGLPATIEGAIRSGETAARLAA